MISYRDIGNYYEIIFNGTTLEDLNTFHKSIKNLNKTNYLIWSEALDRYILAYKINKNDLDSLLNIYPNAIKITNSYDDIGSTMKLTPYLYQRESIEYGLKTQNALIILPCGSGKLYYIS